MSKDFQEFVSGLTQEHFDIISKRAEHYKNVSIENNKNLSLGNQVMSISIDTTLGILELYHSWLNDQ